MYLERAEHTARYMYERWVRVARTGRGPPDGPVLWLGERKAGGVLGTESVEHAGVPPPAQRVPTAHPPMPLTVMSSLHDLELQPFHAPTMHVYGSSFRRGPASTNERSQVSLTLPWRRHLGNLPFISVSRSRRSALGLVGGSLNVMSSAWANRDSTIGPGSDSYYEYLLKVGAACSCTCVYARRRVCVPCCSASTSSTSASRVGQALMRGKLRLCGPLGVKDHVV